MRFQAFDGVFEMHGVLLRDSYGDAILTVQNSIMDDFGYESWEDFISCMNPDITEKNGVYAIHAENCGHEEYYKIEKLTI